MKKRTRFQTAVDWCFVAGFAAAGAAAVGAGFWCMRGLPGADPMGSSIVLVLGLGLVCMSGKFAIEILERT